VIAVVVLAQKLGVSTFAREGDTVYHCYSSSARGVEFLMGYYPILDRTPKGRDEGDAFQTWLRRHDEYESQRNHGHAKDADNDQ
jgi:predicted dithiol-disulfide oxidoreductase (DUF899 family)